MNTETPSLSLFRAQYGQASTVQQKSNLVAFYLKNFIITRTLEFLKTERSQGKDISEMTTDIHNWFQDLEGLKQSLGYQLQDMDTCRQQFFDFTYYHFSRCEAQYKNNTRSQQLADEFANILLLTEAYSIFNAPDQQVDHMRNVAKTAQADILKNLQAGNQKFQPTYSTYSQPPNQGIIYHGHELETPNPDMMPGQSTNQNQLHSIKTPGSTTGPVSALSGFQMVESSFVSKDALAQNRSQAPSHPGANTTLQSQQYNLQSQNRPGAFQSQAYPNPNQSIRGQGILSQQQAAAQDKELIHLDDLLSSMQPANNQASHQSQHQGQGRGPSAYQAGQSIRPADNNQGGGAFSGFNMAESNYVPQQSVGQNQQQNQGGFQGGHQSIRQPGPSGNNQGGAFSGFNMAESNYVPQQSVGQNQQAQPGPSFQGGNSLKPTPGGNNQGGAFSGFNVAESNYVPQQNVGRSQQQGGPGGFPQNMQGYNQSQQGGKMEVEPQGAPFGQGVLNSQYYNPNAGGNFNNNALPDFTKMQNEPQGGPSNYGSQPFNFKQSYNPNQPGPGPVSNLPGAGAGQQNFYGQNAQNTGIQGHREEPIAQEAKKEASKVLPSKQGGGHSAGPPLSVPNDKVNQLKELCKMTISELDYKNVKEAKENIRRALAIIKEHNPGM